MASRVLLLAVLIIGLTGAETYKRTILITGSSDGIGRETAKQLAQDPENYIILHGRNFSRCDNVSKWLHEKVPTAHESCVVSDFRNLTQVMIMADYVKQAFPRLNVVLLNAGIFPQEIKRTGYDLEETFQVNHLAHFLLIRHLLDHLITNSPARIVATSSVANTWVKPDRTWDDFYANITKYTDEDPKFYGTKLFKLEIYGRSKLWNIMFINKLAQKLKGTNVTANSLHPGHWQTKLSSWTGYPVEGVQTPSYLAVSPDVDKTTSKYFNEDQRSVEPNELASRPENQEKLWEFSENILNNLEL